MIFSLACTKNALIVMSKSNQINAISLAVVSIDSPISKMIED